MVNEWSQPAENNVTKRHIVMSKPHHQVRMGGLRRIAYINRVQILLSKTVHIVMSEPHHQVRMGGLEE